jgi:hypothetical protein
MALVACRECGKEISSEAEACPNCGVGKQKKRYLLKIVGVLIVGLILMFIAAQIVRKTSSSNALDSAVEKIGGQEKRYALISHYRKNPYKDVEYACGVSVLDRPKATPDDDLDIVFFFVETIGPLRKVGEITVVPHGDSKVLYPLYKAACG